MYLFLHSLTLFLLSSYYVPGIGSDIKGMVSDESPL